MKDFNSITTWSVSKGVATPVNPHETATAADYYRRKSEGISWGDFLKKQWMDFEAEKQQHTYATNAPDGSYSTDCFGKIVWQYKDWITEKQDFNEWIDVTDNFADSITVKNNWPSEKRRFLPFIQGL